MQRAAVVSQLARQAPRTHYLRLCSVRRVSEGFYKGSSRSLSGFSKLAPNLEKNSSLEVPPPGDIVGTQQRRICRLLANFSRHGSINPTPQSLNLGSRFSEEEECHGSC